MLATNLLKKDLTSPLIPIMTLPLITLPHIITSSLALSVLTDLLPRLSHSQPSVRKKTVVTLYRLALVYPETLRVAWPKIKERLSDPQEDSSVTAATVNVICELGWRRPQDFLPLAPRLFDLLIDGGNNWMAIKIIKLFAVLTPLEPRLVKKLVKPLTNLIQSTSAMSLLYECINGIIQGGILDGAEGSIEQDDVANLCITKLRGMIVLDGDPNLKYVALLAFNKILASHPILVSQQQDVILGCLDDPDISIRTQALELVSGIVSSDNLHSIVNRLVKQLSTASRISSSNQSNELAGVPVMETENTDLEQKLVADKRGSEVPPLPEDYRREVITRILDMCSNDTYAKITDFEWYIDTLVRLVRLLPPITSLDGKNHVVSSKLDVAGRIGFQILDIAVRVKELRSETTKAAETLLIEHSRSSSASKNECGESKVLEPVAWVVGEFASDLTSAIDTWNSLIHESSLSLPARTLTNYVQAVPKVFAYISRGAQQSWNSAQKTTLQLQLARTTDFLEKLATHPNLDVQERSVEYLELLRLASEALSSQPSDSLEAPFLITSAIPGLFNEGDLKPVAVGAQKKVPLPVDIDLDALINPGLQEILQQSQTADVDDPSYQEFEDFYKERETVASIAAPAMKSFEPEDSESVSYQAAEDPETRARRRAARSARNKDDPFYIPQDGESSGISTPLHDVLSTEDGDELDVEAIPIVSLQIENPDGHNSMLEEMQRQKKKKKVAKRFLIAADETIGDEDVSTSTSPQSRSLDRMSGIASTKPVRPKQNLLSVDSSNLRQFSLEGDDRGDQLDIERREAEEAEMAAAMKEVEQLRLEMQRAAERTAMAEGVDTEGTVVKKKKRRKPKESANDGIMADTAELRVEGEVLKKKKKKKKKSEQAVEADEE